MICVRLKLILNKYLRNRVQTPKNAAPAGKRIQTHTNHETQEAPGKPTFQNTNLQNVKARHMEKRLSANTYHAKRAKVPV